VKKVFKKCPQNGIIMVRKHTKNQRKGALNDMIDRIEFIAKNLT
jgi:hypothetical protein